MNATKRIGGTAALAASIVPAAADFASSGKVVTSYLKGDGGNARSFRTTKKVTTLSSSDPKVVSARLAPGGYRFDVTVKKAGKAKPVYELAGAPPLGKAVCICNQPKSYA